ncbi:hypothetical protein [Cytobacillus sp.]|uniref:hypothetical protein n=1 Tax=Cytobacillus sp. TaxID=2675269 RepID=UPI0028BE0EBE|nr:hypothetical protein [Cytobacillus sp.]
MQTELYVDGPISMSPAALEHKGVVANLIGEMGSALKECRAINERMAYKPSIFSVKITCWSD